MEKIEPVFFPVHHHFGDYITEGGNTIWVGENSPLFHACDDYSAWLTEQLNQENKEVVAAIKAIWDKSIHYQTVYMACNCNISNCHTLVLYDYFKTMKLLMP